MDTYLNSQNPESTKKLQEDDDEDDEEETISLRDLPLNTDEIEKSNNHPNNHSQQIRRSTSEPSDFFEFLNEFSPMSHAEDIIFCGQLIPYKKYPRYCESSFSNYMNQTRTNNRLTRSTRSLDREKVARRRHGTTKSLVSDSNMSFSKNVEQQGLVVKVSTKPRWYILMFFGLVRFPKEMDIQDIKNRQIRRRNRMHDGGGGGTIRRSERWWGDDLLRVLSCKSHASIAVDVTSVGGIVS